MSPPTGPHSGHSHDTSHTHTESTTHTHSGTIHDTTTHDTATHEYTINDGTTHDTGLNTGEHSVGRSHGAVSSGTVSFSGRGKWIGLVIGGFVTLLVMGVMLLAFAPFLPFIPDELMWSMMTVLPMVVPLLIPLVLVFLFVFSGVDTDSNNTSTHHTTPSTTASSATSINKERALETLRERFARGEITAAEFEAHAHQLLETESISQAREYLHRTQQVGATGTATESTASESVDTEYGFDADEYGFDNIEYEFDDNF